MEVLSWSYVVGLLSVEFTNPGKVQEDMMISRLILVLAIGQQEAIDLPMTLFGKSQEYNRSFLHNSIDNQRT